MPFDRSFVQLNRASTERLRRLINRITDAEVQRPLLCLHA